MLQQGIAQIRGEDTLEGYATLRRVVERAPRNAEAWLWMGWAAAQQKDHRTAQRCFLQAQRLGHPKAAQALEWLKG
jgi:Flp pilus assembly protein TadD